MILYDYWRSSAAYRLRIALAHLGETWESVPVDLVAGAQTSPEHLARNPQGLVPVLDIDGSLMSQSLAILEYLDETRQAGFLPKEPKGRARVRSLACAIAMEIHPVCNLRVAKHAVAASDGAITMEGWMRRFIPEGLKAVEALLDDPQTGRFCHGDDLTLADICLVPQLYNARRWGVDLTEFSRLSAIDAALAELPSVQAAHPDRWAPKAP